MDSGPGKNLRTERAKSVVVVSDWLSKLEPDPVAAACPALNLQSLKRPGAHLKWLYRERSVTLDRPDGSSLGHPIEHLLVWSRIVAEVPRSHGGKDIAVLTQCSCRSRSA